MESGQTGKQPVQDDHERTANHKSQKVLLQSGEGRGALSLPFFHVFCLLCLAVLAPVMVVGGRRRVEAHVWSRYSVFGGTSLGRHRPDENSVHTAQFQLCSGPELGTGASL